MTKIEALTNPQAPDASRTLLEAAARKMGKAPNLLRVLAHGPAALASYLGLAETLAGGLFDAQERELIALAVAESNACDYCLAAHTTIGGMQGLAADDMLAARTGDATDPRRRTLTALAQEIVTSRGRPTDASVDAFRAAGWTDGHLVELIALVTLNTLTNYTNHIAGTEIDFPAAPALATA